MGDVTVTAAAPTFPIPSFLQAWETDTSTSSVHVFKKLANGEAPGSYEKVQVHNFRFLGQEFGTSGYVGRSPAGSVVSTHSGGGVCSEFKLVLVAAQRRIYQDFARQQTARGRDPTSEAEFKSYCGVKGPHAGWQFRGGNHRFGNAVDIDALFNPYITVGQRGGPVGGEQPTTPPTGSDVAALDNLRFAAITAYENAVSFMLGSSFDPSRQNLFVSAAAGEDAEQLYRRFATLHEALAWYMSTAMQPRANNVLSLNTPDLPRDLDDMRERLRQHINFKLAATNPGLSALLSDRTKLSNLRDQIAFDHEALRKTMLFGDWEVKAGRIVNASTTRDPCNGILSLRKEIVTGLRVSGTRWGAGDFGPRASGDVMHFDTLEKPTTTTDPNPSQLTFARK